MIPKEPWFPAFAKKARIVARIYISLKIFRNNKGALIKIPSSLILAQLANQTFLSMSFLEHFLLHPQVFRRMRGNKLFILLI